MITKLKDLGILKGRRYYKVKCECGKTWPMQAGQFNAGYTNWCTDCGKKHRKENQRSQMN